MVEDGAAEVDGVVPELSHEQLLRSVVQKEVSNLDEYFLAALNGCGRPVYRLRGSADKLIPPAAT